MDASDDSKLESVKRRIILRGAERETAERKGEKKKKEDK